MKSALLALKRTPKFGPVVKVDLWKQQLLEGSDLAFESTGSKAGKSDEPKAADLYQQMVRLKVELEWLKK